MYKRQWHDTVHKEPQGFHQETTGTDKWIQQRAGCKISIQESVVLLYANNELTERDIKKTILFTIASKKTKIPKNKPNHGCKRPVHGKL